MDDVDECCQIAKDLFKINKEVVLGNVIGTLPFEAASSKETDVELRVVKGNDLVDVKPGSHDLILKKGLDRDEVYM